MEASILMPDDPGISIDAAHCALLAGLIRAQKPRSVLEFGWGQGKSAEAIQKALCDNLQYCPHFLVDNWADWGGVCPSEETEDFGINSLVKFVNQSECEYVANCTETFDFILSDADHMHAQEWFFRVYRDLLNPGGILVYHDVCQYANLGEIVEWCKAFGKRFVLFNRNSLSGEHCERGLLVIFKPIE